MIKALTLAATAAAALATGGAVQAHEHGYGARADLPPPAYAYDGRAYTVYERPANKGFPILGADAGLTVLGVHLGGSAKIRLGVDEELQHRRKVYVSRAAAPSPVSARGGERGYSPMPCGCDGDRGRW